MTKIQRDKAKGERAVKDNAHLLKVGYGVLKELDCCRVVLLPDSWLDEPSPNASATLEVYDKLKEDARFQEVNINGFAVLVRRHV